MTSKPPIFPYSDPIEDPVPPLTYHEAALRDERAFRRQFGLPTNDLPDEQQVRERTARHFKEAKE